MRYVWRVLNGEVDRRYPGWEWHNGRLWVFDEPVSSTGYTIEGLEAAYCKIKPTLPARPPGQRHIWIEPARSGKILLNPLFAPSISLMLARPIPLTRGVINLPLRLAGDRFNIMIAHVPKPDEQNCFEFIWSGKPRTHRYIALPDSALG